LEQNESNMMKKFIENTIKQMTDYPDEIRVAEIAGEHLSIYELRCHEQDIGRVIGKNGSTIAAVRVLLGVMASKQGRRAILEVVD